MKKIDLLKRQRYEISMRIIELEAMIGKVKNADKLKTELNILKEKETKLNLRINLLNN